ncbi:hypothetical protein HU200_065074 [Digitaria exilis]|uniref:VQ domain-containing protein n=1 Tax=Digitaria exilis TaxID=1010633 RepID=A0A835AAC7_9POAL|nr:hypothetical protein HU200_065074 [Digitaria exilis]
MDSGNSGSLQSSSGGDDEFDSRGGGGGVDSSPLSALLRPSPSPSSAAFSLHGSCFGLQDFTSAPPHHHHQQQQQQQAGVWSGASGSFAGTSGVSSPRVAHTDAAAARPHGVDAAVAATTQGQEAAGMGAPAAAPAQQPPPRGSRKRTRASRRAPTTVLTTDTSNFRAMVQEFTGIPSPPFGAAVGIGVGSPAASLRTRFDHIFPPPSSSLRSGAGAGDAATASLPPYLLRPFPHKLPTTTFPPFTSTSSSSTPSSSSIGVANANAATGTAATTTASASSTNPVAPTAASDTFQQLTSSALLRLHHDPSSYLSFQNLLDSQGSSPPPSIFGGGFAQSSRLHDLVAPSPSDFLAGGVGGSGGLGLAHGGPLGSDAGMHLHHTRSDVHGHGHGGDELSGVVAAGASGGSCKLNYSHAGAATSSSAAAGADKQPDGGGGGAPGWPGRGDGLDPWICTSE